METQRKENVQKPNILVKTLNIEAEKPKLKP